MSVSNLTLNYLRLLTDKNSESTLDYLVDESQLPTIDQGKEFLDSIFQNKKLDPSDPLQLAVLIVDITSLLPNIDGLLRTMWAKLPTTTRQLIKDYVRNGNSPKNRDAITALLQPPIRAILGHFIENKEILDMLTLIYIALLIRKIFQYALSLPNQ